jgi:hypothetical protein
VAPGVTLTPIMTNAPGFDFSQVKGYLKQQAA